MASVSELIRTKVAFGALCLTALLIPLAPRMVGGAMGLYLLSFLLGQGWKDWNHRSFSGTYLLWMMLPAVLWLWHVLGLIWSEDVMFGWDDIGKKVTLILVPGVLGGITWGTKRIQTLFQCFALGLVLSVLWNFSTSTFLGAPDPEANPFHGHFLVKGIHLGYFAMFLLWGLILLADSNFRQHLPEYLGRSLPVLLVGALLMTTLILTGSKMGFFLLVLLSIVVTVFWILQGLGLSKAVRLITIVFASIAILLTTTDYLSMRLEVMYERTFLLPLDTSSIESTMARRMSWDCSASLMNDAPLTGVGTGDIHTEQMACYESRDYVGPLGAGLDPHSQYLQVGATLGYPALLILFLCFALPGFTAWKRRDLLSIGFFTIVGLACITEGVLERQAGLHFYVFFMPFVLQHILYREETPF